MKYTTTFIIYLTGLATMMATPTQAEKIADIKDALRSEANRLQEEKGITDSFGLIITNDEEMGKTISENADLIESKIPLEDLIAEKQSELGKMVSKSRMTESRLQSIKTLISDKQKEVSSLNQKVKELRSVETELSRSISEKETTLTKLQRRIAKIRKNLVAIETLASEDIELPDSNQEQDSDQVMSIGIPTEK